jgi:hypothetical protein
MKYSRTMVSDGVSIFPIGTVEHEGRLWLVPKSRVNLAEGWQMPARMICPLSQAFRPMPARARRFADYQLGGTVPKAVLEGRAQQSEMSGFEVVEAPQLRFPVPKDTH